MNDDLVVLHTQYSTQWDGLGHAGAEFDANGDDDAEIVYYNGWRAGVEITGPDDVESSGVDSLGVASRYGHHMESTSNAGPLDMTQMAINGVQGRAVLIDLEAHFGTERSIVSWSDLSSVLSADHVIVEPGDMVVIHTGFARLIERDRGDPDPSTLASCAVLDGSDIGLHDWVRDNKIAAIAADNYAVESFPSRNWETGQPLLPFHRLCLFELGIHLGELWQLSDLAAYLRSVDRSRFLLTAPPLRLPRVSGSPVTPIATV